MNQEKVMKELSEKYPGKQIIKNDIEIPTEIICEVKSTVDHPSFSQAIAVVDRSLPHLHKKSTEEYSVIRGELFLFVDGKKIFLKEGDTYIIHPHQIHWAQGNETWVSCFSQPGWKQEDHILMNDPSYHEHTRE